MSAPKKKALIPSLPHSLVQRYCYGMKLLEKRVAPESGLAICGTVLNEPIHPMDIYALIRATKFGAVKADIPHARQFITLVWDKLLRRAPLNTFKAGSIAVAMRRVGAVAAFMALCGSVRFTHKHMTSILNTPAAGPHDAELIRAMARHDKRFHIKIVRPLYDNTDAAMASIWLIGGVVTSATRTWYDALTEVWCKGVLRPERLDSTYPVSFGLRLLLYATFVSVERFYELDCVKHGSVVFLLNILVRRAKAMTQLNVPLRCRVKQPSATDKFSGEPVYAFDWHQWLPRRGKMFAVPGDASARYCALEGSLGACLALHTSTEAIRAPSLWNTANWTGFMPVPHTDYTFTCRARNYERLAYARVMHAIARVYFSGVFALAQLQCGMFCGGILPVYVLIMIVDQWYALGSSYLSETTRVAISQSAMNEVRQHNIAAQHRREREQRTSATADTRTSSVAAVQRAEKSTKTTRTKRAASQHAIVRMKRSRGINTENTE